MQAQGVDMGKGLAWYGDGWEIFTRNPGMWIVLMILLLVIAAVLNLVPLLGPLLFALLLPGLFGGALYTAREAAEQREMDVSHLFIGFKDGAMRNALLVLGAVLLGANILFLFLALLLIGSGMGMAGMLLALLLLLLLGLLLSMVFLSAVPLVMFAAAEPVAAMKSSFSACLNNVLPLLLFGVIYIVLALIAMIPFGLGLLVLLPVTFGALYASYRDIYAVLAA
jgi:uncharacterized membrane protein